MGNIKIQTDREIRPRGAGSISVPGAGYTDPSGREAPAAMTRPPPLLRSLTGMGGHPHLSVAGPDTLKHLACTLGQRKSA